MAEALKAVGTASSRGGSQGFVISRPAMAAISRPTKLTSCAEIAGTHAVSTLSNGSGERSIRRGVRSAKSSMRTMICDAHGGGLGRICVAGCCSLPSNASFSGAEIRNVDSWNKNRDVLSNEKSIARKSNSVRCNVAAPFDGSRVGRLNDGCRRLRIRSKGDHATSIRNEIGETNFAGIALELLRARGGRRKGGKIMAFWLWGKDEFDEEVREVEEVEAEVMGPLNSIGDFTRFMDNGDDGAELQTAVVTYRKSFPWNLISRIQVDLVAAVHIADKKYFENLQEELASYDRVLYEMVADKNPKVTNRNAKYRWRPPKRRSRSGFSIIGTIQRVMARLLTLDYQLECMDYRRDNWFHADLDYETFQKLQTERGETFFSFAKDLTEISTKTVMRNLSVSSDLEPWRSKLLWVARVFPMPLLGLVVIESVCAPSDAPLNKSPEMKALLELDLASALKVYLAKQITTDLTDSASSVMENSVIIGERNRVALEELEEAMREGCKKVAIFYGSGHLPDMHARLTRDFGLEATDMQWRTAWSIQSRKKIQQGALTNFLGSLAKVSGWPLNRYQTLSLLFLSVVLAVDLWFWELFLGAINDYAQQTVVLVVNLLERGWNL